MKEEYGRSLQILLAVCGLVLLIACANVANLLLARAAARRAQTALRLAIGASRRQIVTQALVESVLLALAGGAAGLLVAIGAARLLLALAFSSARFLPISVQPSPLVLAFAFGVALLTGVVFGAAPAWFATRTHPMDALRTSGRSGGRRSSPARTALLVAPGGVVGRARRRRDDARPQPRQPGAPGLRLPGSRARAGVAQPAAGQLHAAAADGALPRHRGAAWTACPACRAPGSRCTTR